MPLETAEIVYVFGPSGAGKSFTGDYLTVVHDFEHVDGDYPLKHSHLPENYEAARNFLLVGSKEKYPEAKKELWSPYFEKIANMAIEAAETNDRVVLSHATDHQPPRDVVIEALLSGGIKREQITVVQLTVDNLVLLAGHYERSKRQAEQSGTTIEEGFKGLIDFEGELTKEKYIEYMSSVWDPKKEFADDPAAKKVDVSSRGVAHFDNLDAALGLARDGSLSYEEICAKVLPLDEKRDEEAMACGGWEVMGKIFEELFKPAPEVEKEEKVEKVVRRRSSIAEVNDRLNSLKLSSRNLRLSSRNLQLSGENVEE